MALFDIFKRKKPAKSPQERTIRRAGKPEVAPTKPKKISGQAYRILKKVHVTEKATDLTSRNQYIFDVFQDANKNQVKKAVEDLYGVDVASVNIVNIPRKRRRLGKTEGWKGGSKKAIVRIKEGQKIEVLPR